MNSCTKGTDICPDDTPCPVQSNESEDYCLYNRIANDEACTIARYIQDSVEGPLVRQKVDGLSFLDIGAGDGRLLQALCADQSTIKVYRYSAFESNKDLFKILKTTTKKLGFEGDRCLTSSSWFDSQISTKNTNGCADVVILSHCLYGAENKLCLIDHALKFVSPGGILFIVHKWEENGTLEKICKSCNTKPILYHCHIWDSQLDLSNLNETERHRMNCYTKGDVPLEGQQTQVKRPMGFVAIEPDSCTLRHKDICKSIAGSYNRVSHLARLKNPAAVVKPNTVIGIQACLRAASQRTFGNGKVTVIGGGHSENAFANNAIAIDMQLWNHVEVEQNKRLVRVGGGAKIGAVTRECEKYGLTVPLGDRPGVGVGLILLGGLNHLMRKFGLATDNIVKVRYVSPTGKLKEATTKEDLFPFRGAGSNFGVVVEVTLRAYCVKYIAAQDITYVLPKKSTNSKILTKYSQAAEKLSENSCLDGFLFWSSHDQVSFSTSHFDIREEAATEENPVILDTVEANVKLEEPSTNTPSELYDRELYMTKVFAPERVLRQGEITPQKLRSKKRCLFLPPLAPIHEKILLDMIQRSPTKWSYVHFLHGDGAVGKISSDVTAFGCRDWLFAAVITARWPSDDDAAEVSSTKWLEDSTKRLIPYSKGVYGSDLGPKDELLARHAFGFNNLRLAQAKQRIDPLNILGCACPLTITPCDSSDSRVQSRGIVIVVCGPRCCGKDWLTEIVAKTLKMLLLDSNSVDGDSLVVISSISDATKMQYAEETYQNPPVDTGKLITDRVYKEKHRKSLSAFYHKKQAQDVTYDAKCYVDIIQRKNNNEKILLITGMREGLDYARTLAGGRPVVLVNVNSCNKAKQSRGWMYDPDVDKSKGECDPPVTSLAGNDGNDIDSVSLWDLEYDNGLTSNSKTAEDWTKNVVVPCILKACVRYIPDMPQPGVKYRDIIGSFLLQPFALPLWVSSVSNWLRTTRGGSLSNIDAIVAPEALGFVFAGALAPVMKKPLVLIRKEGRLVGNAVDGVSYNGSNMNSLKGKKQEQDEEEEHRSTMNDEINNRKEQFYPSCSFEIIVGSIIPGQRIMVVDDCLASGSTLEGVSDLVSRQGGIITKIACLMELPDLDGRLRLNPSPSTNGKLDIFSVMEFPGK